MINFYGYDEYNRTGDYKIGEGFCFNIDGLNKYYLQNMINSITIHGRFPFRCIDVEYYWLDKELK